MKVSEEREVRVEVGAAQSAPSSSPQFPTVPELAEAAIPNPIRWNCEVTKVEKTRTSIKKIYPSREIDKRVKSGVNLGIHAQFVSNKCM